MLFMAQKTNSVKWASQNSSFYCSFLFFKAIRENKPPSGSYMMLILSLCILTWKCQIPFCPFNVFCQGPEWSACANEVLWCRKVGFFFTEKDIILHIQSPVCLFIYLFTFCNHGCFQTSYKCIKAKGSIRGKCTIFFFSWVSTPPLLQKEKRLPG